MSFLVFSKSHVFACAYVRCQNKLVNSPTKRGAVPRRMVLVREGQ